IKEYQSVQDFLFSNLTTQAEGYMLETGGSVYLEAFEGDREVIISDGKTIDVGFPTSKPKQDMTDFQGFQNDYNQVEWYSEMQNREIIYDYIGYMVTCRIMDENE